jgi:hypothetical protein
MITDVAPGLWVWTVEHPDYAGDPEWDGRVACTCVESRGEVALLDPLDGSDEVAARLDATPPTYVAILKPDHIRHVDAFAARYGIPAYGPSRCTGATTSPGSSSRRSGAAPNCPAGCAACGTGAASSRRRYGCPSSARSCSRTG